MKKIYLALLMALAVLLAGFGVWKYVQNRQYQESHVFVEDAVYPADAQSLDLRGKPVSREHYEALKEKLPRCHILWDVSFQGGTLSSDTREVTVTSLTDEDVEVLLSCFPELAAVDAGDCRDYGQLQALQEGKPDCQVSYMVSLGGQDYPLDTQSITFREADGQELLENLKYLKGLKAVHFPEPKQGAETLLALKDAYPDIAFTWEKTVLGKMYSSTMTELDLSGTPLTGVEELEADLAYFPELETLLLADCGLDNETLAAYRDRVREQYKVVWTISVGMLKIRTDETTFMPSREGIFVNDSHLTELKYCEDMIVVDVGHKGVKNIDWVYGMPHLQYLIVADTDVEDITPIGTLKELIYLELFKCPGITDYTPLLNCTALQDLNLAYTSGDVSVLAEMTWLKTLWANCCNASKEQKQLLRDSLPNTLLELDHGWHMGNGWRNRENYYIMRDLLGMPYYDWGSERLEESGG